MNSNPSQSTIKPIPVPNTQTNASDPNKTNSSQKQPLNSNPSQSTIKPIPATNTQNNGSDPSKTNGSQKPTTTGTTNPIKPPVVTQNTKTGKK